MLKNAKNKDKTCKVTISCFHCTHGIGICLDTTDEDLLMLIKEKEHNYLIPKSIDNVKK